MSRSQINYEATTARFPKGTLERMTKVSMRFESMADFIREAVLEVLERREKMVEEGIPTEFNFRREAMIKDMKQREARELAAPGKTRTRRTTQKHDAAS